MDRIDKANTLMKTGKWEEAKHLLQALLQEYPSDDEVYQAAVNIYLYANMYTEAKEVFKLYKERTGKELKADFSLEEIEGEERKKEDAYNKYEREEFKTFRCKPFLKRAKVSGLFSSIFPIKEIRIYPRMVTIKKGNKKYCYNWVEIIDAYLFRENVNNRYVAFTEETLVLKTFNRIFKLNVTTYGDFAYFENSDFLIQEFKKYIKIKNIEKKGVFTTSFRDGLIFFGLLLLLYFIMKAFGL